MARHNLKCISISKKSQSEKGMYSVIAIKLHSRKWKTVAKIIERLIVARSFGEEIEC
jgi:hypothetical protein